MRLMLWHCEEFSWRPALKTLENSPEASPGNYTDAIVAFVHIESKDVEQGSSAEKKLLKNLKWLANKWNRCPIILHSFTHLGEDKADAEQARDLLDHVSQRLNDNGFEAIQTPYGYFLDLNIKTKGHPLARIYKSF